MRSADKSERPLRKKRKYCLCIKVNVQGLVWGRAFSAGEQAREFRMSSIICRILHSVCLILT